MTQAGKIKKWATEYSVDCGICQRNNVEHWHTKKEFELSLRDFRWSETKQHGWICPTCKAEGLE